MSLLAHSRRFFTSTAVAASAPATKNAYKGFTGIKSKRFDIKASVDPNTYNAYQSYVTDGVKMPKEAADNLAKSMMNWAMGLGATKFAHWFHPVRAACGYSVAGLKKETFLDFDYGDKSLLKNFQPGGFNSGKLFASETDGSSYPHGGLRATHEASAFTGWDILSPPFVRDSTLYIPACFVTWNGHALDEKTPMLRSTELLNKQGVRLLRALGFKEPKQVVANVGCEQEYFIIPNNLVKRRPDIMGTGRTIIGASPARGQQTSQNYFGKYPPRISRMMHDVEEELWALGMSLVVQHNEVAPSQHEFSPVFALANVAGDQNIMAQEVMDEVAARHDLRVLWHEKPFKGINGSGKHCNWGLNTDTGDNLYVPGKTQAEQARFMCFVAALTRAMHIHGDAFRCGVAVAGNDHRLGAQEAPPAIMSLYTGRNMEEQIKKIIAGGALHGYSGASKVIDPRSAFTAPITGGAEDRNRTAPFPFCGNRWEFRAVGSSQNVNFPLTIVNAAVAESLGVLAEQIENGKSPRDAAADMFKEHFAIIFNGNGYSEEWVKEAERRGLPNLRTSIDALRVFDSPKNRKMLQGVFSEEEIVSRTSVLVEEFTNTIKIEANVMVNMLETGVVPAAEDDLKKRARPSRVRFNTYDSLEKSLEDLKSALNAAPKDVDQFEEAQYIKDFVRPQMNKTRAAADEAEKLIDARLYPYPTYEQMLYQHHFDA